jgi:N-formylglutamate amidohydrolase
MWPSIALTEREILESTDIGSRELFIHLPVRVALWARWSRLAADLNRDHLQRGPEGVIPEVDYYGRDIYRENSLPDGEDVERRLNRYYFPYHIRLREAVEDKEVKILFDCHSLTGKGPPGAPDPLRWRKDIVLGNNGNHRGEINPSLGDLTCPTAIILMIKEAFHQSGFSVSLNRPYSGGFITTHYGQKLVKEGKMALQIEINQELYIDGRTLRLRADKVSEVALRLQEVFREIARNI